MREAGCIVTVFTNTASIDCRGGVLKRLGYTLESLLFQAPESAIVMRTKSQTANKMNKSLLLFAAVISVYCLVQFLYCLLFLIPFMLLFPIAFFTFFTSSCY